MGGGRGEPAGSLSIHWPSFRASPEEEQCRYVIEKTVPKIYRRSFQSVKNDTHLKNATQSQQKHRREEILSGSGVFRYTLLLCALVTLPVQVCLGKLAMFRLAQGIGPFRYGVFKHFQVSPLSHAIISWSGTGGWGGGA